MDNFYIDRIILALTNFRKNFSATIFGSIQEESGRFSWCLDQLDDFGVDQAGQIESRVGINEVMF